MTAGPSAATYLKTAAAALRRGSSGEATRQIRPALVLDPGHADATILAAMGLRASGDASGAVRLFRRALALRPGDVHAQGGLVDLGSRIGQPHQRTDDRALLARVREFPDQSLGWRALGLSALSAGRRSVAWPALRRAALLAPGDRATLPLLILAERRGGARVNWSVLAGRALVVDPNGPATLEAALVAYREARDSTAVLRIGKRLMLGAPGASGAYQATVAVADVALRVRDSQTAVRLTARAESLWPGSTVHAGLRAKLLRDAGRRKAAADYLKELVATRPDDPDTVGLLFNLASMLDEEGDSKGAASALTAANRQAAARSAEYGVDCRRFLKLVDLFAANTVHPVDPETAEASDASPVFLFGIPRSGTTLVGDLLHRHPQVETFDEVDPLPDLVGIENARRREAGDRNGLTSLLASPHPFDARTAGIMRETFHNLLKRHETHPERPIKVDKSPFGLVYIGLVARLFPRARVVLVLRHPADVCLSCLMQEFAATDALASFTSVEETGDLYNRVMSFWMNATATSPLPIHTVRYESLVDDPESELKRLVGFLGLEWDRGILDHQRTVGRYTATPSYRQVARPINRDAVGRWMRYRDYLAPAWPYIEPWVKRFGYDAG